MNKGIKSLPFFIFIFSLSIILPSGKVFAATDPIADFCATPQAQADYQARKECQDLLELQDANTKIKGEKDSIENEIKLIDVEIQIALQKIKVQERIISQLSGDIKLKSQDVIDLQGRIDSQLKSIKSMIQRVNERDAVSLPSIMLGNKDFSTFYTEVDAFYTLNKELTQLINEIKSVKTETEEAKQNLEDRKDKETDAKQAIEAQKRLIDRKRADKNALLKLKTTEYNTAQKLLADQKAKVAQIRARLFKFQDGEGIPFGDAYDYAVKASAKTGVRPALILAVLAQESSRDENGLFGTHIGSCYVRDIKTGDGVGKNTGRKIERVMYSDTTTKRPSDTTAFLDITSRLGRDWMNTAVSCPPDPYGDGEYYSGRGFGGGMGPTQFIPSTWELVKKSIGTALGINQDQVDPWNYEHAIMAAGVLLKSNGAAGGTYSAERNSACLYYSGAKCTPGRKPANVFYGDQVMAKAADFQDDIDVLTGK